MVSYQVRTSVIINRREMHCVDTNNEDFFERFPSPSPSSSPSLEVVNHSTSSTSIYSRGGLLFAICTIVAVAVVVAVAVAVAVVIVVVIVVVSKKRNGSETTEPFINNRIIVSKSGEDGVPNYGTFSS